MMWKELFRESVKIDEKKTLRTKFYGMTTFKSWEEIIVPPPQKKGGGNDQRHKMKINVTEIKETKGIAKVSILLNVLETKLNKNFAWHLRQI